MHDHGFGDLHQRFFDRIAERLAEPLFERHALRSMAPSLAYGRHRGPCPADTRQAAVAIVFFATADEPLWLPLTVRPKALKHHGGQVSFPGGRLEESETPVEAAIRELHEELGPLPAFRPRLLGLLSPIYVYASHNLVTPVVLAATAPKGFDPDPLEVERLIRVPIEQLEDHRCRVKKRLMRPVRQPTQDPSGADGTSSIIDWWAPAWRIGDDDVWGATAMILAELASVIGQTSS